MLTASQCIMFTILYLFCTCSVVQSEEETEMAKFSDVKKQVIGCLLNGNVDHEARGSIAIKNLLAIGDISTDDVADILKKAKGTEYETSPHHDVKEIDVHIIKTRYAGEDWYIKWYFLEPDSVFISVHH